MTMTKGLVSLILTVSLVSVVMAQCALCKSAVASSGDVNLIRGLQMGIGLLLLMPYLVVGTIGLFIYRAYRAQSRPPTNGQWGRWS